jgi:tetratricopeptide (TPR) repeat protein
MTTYVRNMPVTALAVLMSVQVTASAQGQTSSEPRPKDQFVTSLMQFVEALPGTYGDEGTQMRSSLRAMRQALARWDDSISTYQALVTAEIRNAPPRRAADAHRDLAILNLDRGRVDDAARELAAALALDGARADVWFLLGVIEGQRNRSTEAAEALRRSSSLDPGKPITFYLLASHLLTIGERDEAMRARQAFLDARRATLARPPPAKPLAAPFVRWDLFQDTMDATPLFPPARYAEGFALLKQGRYADATTRFEDAAATDPLIANRAAVSESISRGVAALRQGQLPSALNQLQTVIATAPKHAEAHRILGTIYWASGQRANAVAQLEAAIRLDPLDERARLALTDAHVAEGRFADAERVLRDAVRDIPLSGQAHYKLGEVAESLQKHADALRELEAAARLTPVMGTDYLYRAIGEMHSKDRDFEAVIAAYAHRVDLNPNNAAAHVALGETYLELGRDSEAQAEFLAALMIDPQRVDAYAPVAQAYLQVGDYLNAELAARRAVELDPTRVEARYTLATSLVRLGRTDEGKRELEQYREMQAEAEVIRRREYEVTALLRDVAQSIGRGAYAEATATLREAIRLKPNDPALHVSVGLVLGKAGRLAEAIASFEQALKLNAGPEVHRHLSDVYTAAGRPDEARRHRDLYEKLLKEGPRR